MNSCNADIFTICSLLLVFVISNVEGNSIEDEVAKTLSALRSENISSRLIWNEKKKWRGYSNSNFDIGESSKSKEIANLNENAIKEEKSDIPSYYSSDVMKFECKREAEEDDVNDDDNEIEKLEKRDISLNYLSDIVKFECKSEPDEDEVSDEDVDEIEKLEKRDIPLDYLSDVVKFECKSEPEEDELIDDDVDEIEKLEKRDIPFDYLSDVVKFECKSEPEEDDANHDDVGVDDVNYDDVGVDDDDFGENEKLEKSDISLDCLSDGIIFERVPEGVSDDTNHNDEIEKLSENKMRKYAVVDPNKNLILYEIEMYSEECDEPFDAISSLEEHTARYYRKKKIFICNYENCNVAFTRFRKLYVHRCKTHGLRFQKKKPTNVIFDELSRRFPTYCVNTSTKTANTAHSLEMHAEGRPPSRQIFFCMVTDCNTAFTTASNMMKHMNSKHGRWKKQKRDRIGSSPLRTFVRQNERGNAFSRNERHKGCHLSRKLFFCVETDCRSVYTTASDLMNHMNAKHYQR